MNGYYIESILHRMIFGTASIISVLAVGFYTYFIISIWGVLGLIFFMGGFGFLLFCGYWVGRWIVG